MRRKRRVTIRSVLFLAVVQGCGVIRQRFGATSAVATTAQADPCIAEPTSGRALRPVPSGSCRPPPSPAPPPHRWCRRWRTAPVRPGPRPRLGHHAADWFRAGGEHHRPTAPSRKSPPCPAEQFFVKGEGGFPFPRHQLVPADRAGHAGGNGREGFAVQALGQQKARALRIGHDGETDDAGHRWAGDGFCRLPFPAGRTSRYVVGPENPARPGAYLACSGIASPATGTPLAVKRV